MVIGNHDVAVTRDRSRAAELRDVEGTHLLRDEAMTVQARGEWISMVGVDPESIPGENLAGAGACRPERGAPRDASATFLASSGVCLRGHSNSYYRDISTPGRSACPIPGRCFTLAHPRARFVAGLYESRSGAMHVSPGTGTTFVPFRFFARPEVTELVLKQRI